MRRDMNLIRSLLQEAENEISPDLSGYSDNALWQHRYWLIEAELAEGPFVRLESEVAIVHPLTRLTWKGCEYWDAIRDENIWKKVQKSFNGFKTSFTFPLVKEVAVQIIKETIT